MGLLATLALTLGVSWILPLVGADASANIANISKDISGDAYDKLVQNYQNLEQYTRDYLFYIGVGAIPTVLSSAMSNLVKGEGAAKVSMFGMMIGAVTNIILDPIMILAMGMGVKGCSHRHQHRQHGGNAVLPHLSESQPHHALPESEALHHERRHFQRRVLHRRPHVFH